MVSTWKVWFNICGMFSYSGTVQQSLWHTNWSEGIFYSGNFAFHTNSWDFWSIFIEFLITDYWCVNPNCPWIEETTLNISYGQHYPVHRFVMGMLLSAGYVRLFWKTVVPTILTTTTAQTIENQKFGWNLTKKKPFIHCAANFWCLSVQWAENICWIV
jgi:hypothetical protein